jgi:hypothetical protein
VGSQGLVWHDFSTDNPGLDTFQITTAYPYYYVSIWECVYSEKHYYWAINKPPADQMAVAIDNVDLRFPVALLADVNLDGSRNALDISSFIQRVTSGPYQAEADCNQDGAVNALDIAKFIYYVTGGTGDTEVVPEPAAAAVFMLSTLALLYRRVRRGTCAQGGDSRSVSPS